VPRIVELAFAALVIVCATLLSVVWVFRVPMFLEPDEIAHADASFAYFNAGRPLDVVGAKSSNFVTPETRYLMRAVEYRRLRYDAHAVVPKTYGSRAFFRGVDAHAPAPNGVTAGDRTIPYALVVYPATYYVLIAACMRAGWAGFDRSLTAAFFVGRLANSAMLSATLVFAYLILRKLRLSVVDRFLLFVGVSFFPMSTWMSAYIQPDNLSALLTSAALYYALALRKTPESATALLALAITESLLGITKLQYAVVTIFAFALALRNRFDHESVVVRIRAVAVGVVVPSLVVFVGRHLSPAGTIGLPPSGERYAQLGTIATIRAAATALGYAASDTFFGGKPFESFWLHFGIRDEGTFRGPVAEVSAVALCGLTLLTIVAWLVRQGTVFDSLVRISRRYGILRASHFIGNDPFLNLYGSLTALLFALYAFTGGYLTLQGRYWYPVLLPIVVVSVGAIGRVVRRPRAPVATRIACLFWAGFSLTSAPLALAAMQSGFYGQTDVVPIGELGEIESISFGGRTTADVIHVSVPGDVVVTVRGTALDTSNGLPATDIRYQIDGSAMDVAETRLPDRILATRFDDPVLEDAGFAVSFPTSRLASGTHVLRIAAFERRAPAGLTIASLTFRITRTNGP
jgi:hypothetical protein